MHCIENCMSDFTNVLKNFTNFTGKQLRWNIFLIKLKALSSATLLKGEVGPAQVFSCEICEILRTSFSIVHL